LFEESRELFLNPDVNTNKEELEKNIIFDKPDEEQLKEWLLSKSFAETKILNGIERLKKCQGKKNQSRLDNFFKASVISTSTKKVEAPKGKGKLGAKPTSAKPGFRKTTA
jgi:hypothetical protein